MRAREIMSSPVITATPDTLIHLAATLMASNGISSLPVVDESGRVIGIVSELDLLRGRVAHDPTRWINRGEAKPEDPNPASRVGDVMTSFVVCLPEFADTAELAETMIADNLRAIPIVDGDHVVGIVSRRDLVRTLTRDDASVQAEVQARLDSFAGVRDRWKVEAAEGLVEIHGRLANEHERDAVVSLARTVPGVARVHVHGAWLT